MIGIGHIKPFSGFSILTGVLGSIEAFTRGLAVDLAPVRVNTIRPGVVCVSNLSAAMFHNKIEELYRS